VPRAVVCGSARRAVTPARTPDASKAVPSGWLKARAAANVQPMSVTRDVSKAAPSGWGGWGG